MGGRKEREWDEEADEEVGDVTPKNGNCSTLRTLFPLTSRQWSLCLKCNLCRFDTPKPYSKKVFHDEVITLTNTDFFF